VNEQTANPFSSPELEPDTEAVSSDLQPAGPLRWIGLSTLSGLLLFTGYYALISAATVSIWDMWTRQFIWENPGVFVTGLAINCLLAGVFGGMIGTLVGVMLGCASYLSRSTVPPWLLALVGIPFVVSGSVVAFVTLLFFRGQQSESWISLLEEQTTMVIIVALSGVLSLLHLVRNIRCFLILPFRNAKPAE